MSGDRQQRLRVLELYCGIGGCAAALQAPELEGLAAPVAAVDVNRAALAVYAANFPHPVVAGLIETLTEDRLRRWNADLWWMSPPCQPFTRRGLRRDVEDRRARTFLGVLDRLAAVRPTYVAFENVPPFRRSRGHGRLLDTLERAGYRTVRECVLCPTDFRVPNRRRRYYLVAARGRLRPIPAPRPLGAALARYLDPDPSPDLAVAPELRERYPFALHEVRADDPQAVTSCFTSAYGRSPVRSGSYLAGDSGLRRFSPAEILRLLGFPPGYRLPPDLPLATAWRLVANSLSLAPVRTVLAAIPELAGLEP